MSDRPTSWTSVHLAEIVTPDAPIIYSILQPGPEIPGGVPYVRPTEIVSDAIELSELRRTTPEIARRYNRSSLQANDILLSIVGTIGKVALVPSELNGGNITQSSCRVRPDTSVVEGTLVAHFLRAPMARAQFSELKLGTAVPRLNLEDVRKIEFPVPPLAEQRRIVTKIDNLSAKSRRVRDQLDHIPRLVEKYKQAILATAFGGELTREWRLKNASNLAGEPEIRERINIGRRARWLKEEQRKDGLRGKQRSDREILSSYVPNDPAKMHTAPVSGWCHATVGSLGFALGGKRLPKGTDYSVTAPPYRYLRVTDFANGFIQAAQLKYIDAAVHALLGQYIVEENDLFISIAGTIGASGVVSAELAGANLTENAARIILGEAVLPTYLDCFLKSSAGQDQIRTATVATGQPKLALFRIEELVVPIPSQVEQLEIVRLIDTAFSWIDRLAREATSARKLIDHLDQAVLAKAFRGELVPQDANDEPASILLERIRAERTGITVHGEKKPRVGIKRRGRRAPLQP